MASEFRYLNLRDGTSGGDINALFPGWQPGEKLGVIAPHDDDALIGTGYAMEAVMRNGGEVYIYIVCSGDAGYSDPSQKDTIVGIRKRETDASLERFGIPSSHIVRFDCPDFSAWDYIGYKLHSGAEGTFIKLFDSIRALGITRMMIPNGYREHADHEAAFRMGAYDAIQAGDPVLSDHGKPQLVRSMLQYSVWADFSPEDALVSGGGDIRANRAILAPAEVEQKVGHALAAYVSQGSIIQGLMAARAERKAAGGYLELYIAYEPRPKLDFSPYKRFVENMLDA